MKRESNLNKNYFFEKFINKLKNTYGEIAIYGIGNHTKLLLNLFDNDLKDRVVGLIDKDEQNFGVYKYGYKVYDLTSIIEKVNIIVISSDTYEDIIYDRVAYLKEKGIKIFRIYNNIPTISNITGLYKNDKYVVKKLEIEEYKKWNDFVDKSPQGNIFNKTWWLEAGNVKFDIYVSLNKNNEILGGMILPFEEENNINMPMLTQTLGILFKDFDDCKYTKKISKETEIIESLVNVIPENSNYSINFNYNFNNWLPFMWNGYNQYCRYTYVIEQLDNLSLVKENFRYNIKYDINKAQKNGLIIKEDLPIEEFYKIDKQTFDRQQINIPYSLEFLKNLDKKLREKKAAKSFFVVDSLGEIYAANYIIYDENSAYYLMGGSNNKNRSSGAVSLGLWEAIKFAATVTRKFDFEGSCIRNIEEFFRGFGGTQKVYFNIWRKKI